MNEGCDPYKLKKTVADNNEKITRLKEEIQALREEVAITSEQHKAETERYGSKMRCFRPILHELTFEWSFFFGSQKF